MLVVGGQVRKVGKTGLIEALVSALPEMRWTVMKLTPHGHGESDPEGLGDTARYLRAGAQKSLLLQGKIRAEDVRLIEELARGGNVIVESNRILEYVRPDICLMVWNASQSQVKPSALEFLKHADAVVLFGAQNNLPHFPLPDVGEGCVVFSANYGQALTSELLEWLKRRISKSAH